MKFKMKMAMVPLLLLFWSVQAFRIGSEKDCIPPPEVNTKRPQCELHVEAAKESVQVSCHQIQVIRIVGEFNVLRINCSASYPLDFHFDGTTPTEAIQLHSHRTIKESSAELEIKSFHYEVKVLSILALYEHFKVLNKATELRDDFKYSRTGDYQIKGFGENATHLTSYYIFLEEPLAKLDFIQNNRTVWSKENSRIYLPCRPTHYLRNVTLNGNNSDEIETYDVKKGFILKSEALRTFTCECSLDGKVVQMTFDTTREKIQFGFIRNLNNQGVTISFNHQLTSSKTNRIQFNMYSSCEVDQWPFVLNVIAAPTFAHLKLNSDFVLPAFVNRSYGVEIGQEVINVNHVLRTQGTDLRIGAAFCANGNSYDAKIYGVAFNGQIVRYHVHRDIFNISRDDSDIAFYMTIGQKNPDQLIYDGDEVEFTCQAGTALFVPPIVWFVRLTDGSRRRVQVDYNLDEYDKTVSFKLTAATNMTQVVCAASWWYKDFWRNITHDITVLSLSATNKPTIDGSSNPEYKTLAEDSPLVLTCRARGTPLPEIRWKLQGTNGFINTSLSSSTLENGQVTSTLVLTNPMEKTYMCVAKRGNHEAVKLFHVQFSSGIGIWAIVSICFALALTAAFPMFIYFRFFRKQQPLGLKRYEIVEFVSGEVRESRRGSTNEYAHEFAHLCPYDKSYEIDATRFQVDKTSFLGKGAFGVVLKGLVDGTPAAVKMISKNAEKSHLKALLSEVKIHIHLGHHPHVVGFIGANTKDLSKGSVHMFVELCALGNLENYLRTNKDTFLSKGRKPSLSHYTIVMEDLVNWTLQIASGMDHLSSKKVIHGDLAARNVLLDENRVAKITDFGLSRQFQAYSDYVKKQLEPLPWRWMALESLQHLKFSSKSDVWAYGVTVWEIFSLGEIPYVGMSWNLNFVNDLEEGLRLPKPRHAPQDLYTNIMLACWDNRQGLRPSFSQITQSSMKIFGMQDQRSEEPASLPPKAHQHSEYLNIACSN